jgi:hypothetical protein
MSQNIRVPFAEADKFVGAWIVTLSGSGIMRLLNLSAVDSFVSPVRHFAKLN